MTSDSQLHTQFPDSNDSTGLQLWRVTNAWQAAQRAALKPFGLTHVQFVVLASLTYSASADISQKQLAESAGIDPMMTSQVARALERLKLVSRTRHSEDGRVWILAPTPSGVELVNRANVAVEECDRLFFAPLGPRRADFTASLRRLLGHP